MFQRVAVVLVLAGLAAVPATADAADRYALAGGCYSAPPVAEQVRLKATALGRYLLYTKDAKFLAAQEDGKLAPADAPSPAADFAVEDAGGDAFRLVPQSTGKPVATVTFTPAQGCAEFPEADLQAAGTP